MNRPRSYILIVILSICAICSATIYIWNFLSATGTEEIAGWKKQLSPVIEKANQAIVALEADQPLGDRGLIARNCGSGFIIDPAGLILTNEHIIHGAQRIIATLADQRKYQANLLASDMRSDIALLKIDADNFICLAIAPPEQLAIGQLVIALGNPLGTGSDGTAVATFGRINRLKQKLNPPLDDENDRFYDNLIQSDARILPGSSGGPLINELGQAIGINTAIATALVSGRQFGFAITLDETALGKIAHLETGRTKEYAFMGVETSEIDEYTQKMLGLKDLSGVKVRLVLPGSPAQTASLQTGDVIRAIDGRRMHSPDELISCLNHYQVGQTVAIDILRPSLTNYITAEEITIPVRLAQRTLADLKGYKHEAKLNSIIAWGMEVKSLTSWRKYKLNLPPNQTGVLVYQVKPGSPADRKGIKAGAVIIKIAQQYNVVDLADFGDIARKYRTIPTMELLPAQPTLGIDQTK